MEIVEAQRAGVLDQRPEDATPTRKLPDRPSRLLIETVSYEALQVRTPRVDDAQSDIPCLREIGGTLDDPSQQIVQRQLGVQSEPSIYHPMQTFRV